MSILGLFFVFKMGLELYKTRNSLNLSVIYCSSVANLLCFVSHEVWIVGSCFCQVLLIFQN